MRVLITGTSGFIGRALAADMAADHEVVCLSRQPTEVCGGGGGGWGFYAGGGFAPIGSVGL